jgi:hypothetical protein
MADSWQHDSTRRAKAARVDPVFEHAVPVYGAVARKP